MVKMFLVNFMLLHLLCFVKKIELA